MTFLSPRVSQIGCFIISINSKRLTEVIFFSTSDLGHTHTNICSQYNKRENLLQNCELSCFGKEIFWLFFDCLWDYSFPCRWTGVLVGHWIIHLGLPLSLAESLFAQRTIRPWKRQRKLFFRSVTVALCLWFHCPFIIVPSIDDLQKQSWNFQTESDICLSWAWTCAEQRQQQLYCSDSVLNWSELGVQELQASLCDVLGYQYKLITDWISGQFEGLPVKGLLRLSQWAAVSSLLNTVFCWFGP